MHPSSISQWRLFYFFIVVKHAYHTIYHFNQFKVYLQFSVHIVHLAQSSAPAVSRTFLFFQIETLKSINTNPPFCPLRPGSYHFTFRLSECECCRYLREVEPCGLCPSVTGGHFCPRWREVDGFLASWKERDRALGMETAQCDSAFSPV